MDESNTEKQTSIERFQKVCINNLQSNKPVKVIDMNNIRAAIFEKKRLGKNDEHESFYQISFGARYLKDGLWRTSHSFRPREIKFALCVLTQVNEFLKEKLESKMIRSNSVVGLENEAIYAEMQGEEYLETI